MGNMNNDYTLCGNNGSPVVCEVFNYYGRPVGEVRDIEMHCDRGLTASIELKPGVSLHDLVVTDEMRMRRRFEMVERYINSMAHYGLLTQAIPKVTIPFQPTPVVTKSYTTLIKKVIFNPPATIVIWNDDTKTVVKAQEDEPYDPEKGMAMCMAKRMYGDKGSYYDIFSKWLKTYTPEGPADEPKEVPLELEGK